MTIYLDNAATSFPKPAAVYRAVEHALIEVGASPGRAAHRRAQEASALVASAREMAAQFFDAARPDRMVFTQNATESINVVLKGWLRPGDRVLLSNVEHNAVARPLNRLQQAGVKVEKIPCSPRGHIDLDVLRRRLDPPPRLLVLTHASNVNGALQPVPEVARLCSERNVPLLLDAAQTAGLQPISVRDWNLGMLACSGHKGLLGPPGVGVLYIRPDLNVLPLIEGGTGSRSELELQPEIYPDRYESGTPNLPGIAGLAAGLEYISKRGLENLLQHELAMARYLEQQLAELDGVRTYVPETRGAGAVSFTVDGLNPADLGYMLDVGFDIAVRTGLHCAPLAHQTLGTFPAGTVRVSPGYSTTREQLDQFLEALRTLLARR